MSYKKSYRSKKKTARSGNPFSAAGSTTYVKGSDWLPQKLVNNMEYQDQVFMTAVSTPFNYVWRGNSCFDPNQTGTGNSCLGFANMTAIYTQYENPYSSIRVEFINNAAVPVWVAVVPVNTATTVNLNTEIGMPGAKRVYCTSNKDTQQVVVRNYATTKQILNLIPGSGETKANVTANANSQWYWSVNVYSCDTVSPISGVLNIYIKYKTIWSGRKVV